MWPALAMAVCAGAAASCAHNGDTVNPNAHVLQLASIVAAPQLRHCGSATGGQADADVQLNIRIVNTLPEPVDIRTIGVRGVIVRGSPAEAGLLGTEAYVNAALPFAPNPATVRADDGNLIVAAVLRAPCVSGYVDVLLTVVVTTTAGQFVGTPLTLRHTFP